jgi:BA14K-like protein
MNRFLKATVLSIAIAAMILTALAPADAHDHWRRHSDGGDVLAAGVLGLAVGAIAGSALADNPPYRPVYEAEPIYVQPRPVIVRPRPVRPYYTEYRDVGGLEPWSPAWFRWCGDTYRSFDPDTGTFVGYDGQQHFCVAN